MNLTKRIISINEELFSIDIETGLHTLIDDLATNVTETMVPVDVAQNNLQLLGYIKY